MSKDCIARNKVIVKPKLDKILEKYGSVFSKERGTLKGIKAKLNVKVGATPRFRSLLCEIKS